MKQLLFSGLFDPEMTQHLLIGFFMNSAVLAVLILLIYHTSFRRKDFVFTFLLIGTTVFFLSFLLSKVQLNIGFALGLFAIFGIIRYRTDQIPIREMTYLFVVIGLSVINALTRNAITLVEALFANGCILLMVFLMEKLKVMRNESFRLVIYEKLDLLKPGNEEFLKADIRERTGLKVHRVEVAKFNFSKNNAFIKAYFYTGKFENGGSYSGMDIGDDGDDD